MGGSSILIPINATLAIGLVLIPGALISAGRNSPREKFVRFLLSLGGIFMMAVNIGLGFGVLNNVGLFRWARQVPASSFFTSAAVYVVCSIALLGRFGRRPQ